MVQSSHLLFFPFSLSYNHACKCDTIIIIVHQLILYGKARHYYGNNITVGEQILKASIGEIFMAIIFIYNIILQLIADRETALILKILVTITP